MKLTKSGFTIVELLIVILVIAILAAISVVAYNGVQQRSRDSIRKSDLSTIAKLLSMYNVNRGNYISTGSGCGSESNGEGWLSHRSSGGGATQYPRSILDCLKDDGLLTKDVVDPSGCTDDVIMTKCAAPTTQAYMKVNCTQGSERYVYLMARTESSSMPKPTDLNATNCINHGWFNTYGMTYALRVN